MDSRVAKDDPKAEPILCEVFGKDAKGWRKIDVAAAGVPTEPDTPGVNVTTISEALPTIGLGPAVVIETMIVDSMILP